MINNFVEQERSALEWMERSQARAKELLKSIGVAVVAGPSHDEWVLEFPQGSDPAVMEAICMGLMERAAHETKPADSWATVTTEKTLELAEKYLEET